VTAAFDFPNPHLLSIDVAPGEIDGLGHVNNVVYVRWIERVAWDHSNKLGITLDTYHGLDRALVVHRTEVDYIGAAKLGDRVLAATWIALNDGRLRVARRFHFLRESDGQTLLRARQVYVSMEISSGKAKRMPQAFIDAYRPTLPPEA